MPVYEYYCDQCEHTYETLRPASKMDEPAPCPKCGESGKRKLSAFAFRDGRYGHFLKSGAPPAGSSKPSDKPKK